MTQGHSSDLDYPIYELATLFLGAREQFFNPQSYLNLFNHACYQEFGGCIKRIMRMTLMEMR